METVCNSQFPLYRDFHSRRPTRLGEPPPVSLLSWSRGGLVNGYTGSVETVLLYVFPASLF